MKTLLLKWRQSKYKKSLTKYTKELHLHKNIILTRFSHYSVSSWLQLALVGSFVSFHTWHTVDWKSLITECVYVCNGSSLITWQLREADLISAQRGLPDWLIPGGVRPMGTWKVRLKLKWCDSQERHQFHTTNTSFSRHTQIYTKPCVGNNPDREHEILMSNITLYRCTNTHK